ncbi:hypothetical protein C349_04178 [Cryptococcus neoformans var. grubii Br795]|nr:hypothetical protein C359_03869 [Cryptococcus neoformans var. grubii Bt120]OXG48821.1 hypothetical protein C355_03960 [Cryptococcus neoformans var. grubii Th84]OXG78498.1 hypothetical protein C350_04035 [Cryptococcus neoformans var. grubii MW-RSA36]OXG80145.1 hypothetical protein C349_04178 [Cryptococcus neoformans var. grubii Br795]OXG84846.1 hypothetical protein C346_04097 [Cryptococcus neoformans var. grubii D17-1]OXG94849.1 hypothetical protein C345_03973 [Cryptococcus neoformans var. g
MSVPVPTLSPAESSYIVTSLAHPSNPTRTDARPLFASRPIQISYGVFPQANGSAQVKLGGTEVVSGVKLEAIDVVGQQIQGQEKWRTKVEVDVTPQAFPNISTPSLVALSTHLTSIVTSHFIPSIPALPILPNKKYFQPHLHLTILSSSGNIPSALILAARSAFADLKVPKTKVISWAGESGEDANGGVDVGRGDMSGIKAAIATTKGKGKGKMIARGSEDWDLDMEDGEGVKFLEGREALPVLVTLNMVPNSPNIFLDATPQEESACPTHIHLFFKASSPHDLSKPKLCGLRLEGPDGLDAGRVRGLLEQGASVASELIKEVNRTIPSLDI